MKNVSPKKRPSTERERPPVYVTPKGRLYVKADELLRSKRARAVIEQMAKLDFGIKSSGRPPKKRP
jgi:hypothetical protein